MSEYRTFSVPVRGGDLAAGAWEPAAVAGALGPRIPTVLAIHGITASHLAWQCFADALPGARALAPDLRGRGRSRDLPGPWGMRQHADDALRLLDTAGVDAATLVGHSMGAFVAVALAQEHPDRVNAIVLVDGGLPLPTRTIADSDEVADGKDGEDIALQLLGPAAERLRMTFPDHESYRSFWRAHPAFTDNWSAAIEAYVDYDLVGTPPSMHSASLLEAVAADALELNDALASREQLAALRSLPGTIPFLRAPRDLLDRPGGLYAPEVMTRWQAELPNLVVHEIPDVNHYSIIMTPGGVAPVAALVAAQVDALVASRITDSSSPNPQQWQRSPA